MSGPPDSYLDRFMAATEAWLRKVNQRPEPEPASDLPGDIADFIAELD